MDTSKLSQFELKGNTYYTVEGDGKNDCYKCAFCFIPNLCSLCDCTPSDRKDNKSVYFKENK